MAKQVNCNSYHKSQVSATETIKGSWTFSSAITAPTSGNTINGLIINSGALSGVTTISMNNQLTNSLADGTAPFVITSTTKVSNLNVERVDGVHVASLTSGRLLRYNSTGTQIENATVTESSGALGGITTLSMAGNLTIGGSYSILDGNSNELLEFLQTAFAENHIKIQNVGAGAIPIIQSAGSDTDVSLEIRCQGTGLVYLERATTQTAAIYGAQTLRHKTSGNMADGFGTAFLFAIEDSAAVNNYIGRIAAVRNGADNTGYVTVGAYETGTVEEILRCYPVSSAVNYLAVTASAAGADVTIASEGTDSNIDIAVNPKGTGSFLVGDDVTVYSTGIVDIPNQSKARAYLKTSNQNITDTNPNIIVFNNDSDTGYYDSQSEFNTTTGVFTAGKAGDYRIESSIALTGITTEKYYLYIYINGSQRSATTRTLTNVSDFYINISDTLAVGTGETIDIRVQSTSDTDYYVSATFQSRVTIYKVG